MTARVLPLIFSLLAGIAIGAFAIGSDGPAGAPGYATPADTSTTDANQNDARLANHDEIISTIYETLDLEVQERMRLEEELAELQSEVAALSQSLSRGSRPTAAAEKARARERRRGVVDESTLVSAGFNEVEASMIKRRLDEIELDQLFLRDTAIREGWMGSARYRDEVRDLTARRNGLREELGPDGWDKYLYAVGRPNRVQVNSVLAGSPAYNAGLEAGDIILSYDGARVFNQGDVRNQTVGGAVGTMVAVDIERDGDRQQVYIPRGPLGVRLGTTVKKP